VSAPPIVLDLRREAARDPLLLPGIEALDDEERAQAVGNWRERMASEHVSARVFAALVPQLMRAGAARRQLVAVSAMIGQELEHALLCARVLAALGSEAVAPLPALAAVPEHLDAPPLEALLRNVISISCCSETVAVALVATEREQAACPALRELLEQILADEVKHARFGWKLLEEVGPALDRDLRRRLGVYLEVVFAHQLEFHAPFLAMPAASDRALGYGAPHGPSNWQCFVETMTEVTVPGLQRVGLPARAAWDAALAA
jgi:hypothetical protein